MSRSESQQPSQYGRKRSNTVQSILKSTTSSVSIPIVPAIPIRTGDSKVLTLWVHDSKDSPSVVLNHFWWPGVQEGDLLQLCAQSPEQGSGHKALFQVPKHDETVKHQLQVHHMSISKYAREHKRLARPGFRPQAYGREARSEE